MSGQSAFSLGNRRNSFGLDSFALKCIALLTMLIDHVGAILYPDIMILRIIGRISFPIYAFLVAEGFFHTKNVKKYMQRLLVFAIVSEIPFDLVLTGKILEFGHQNVFFTLFAGLGLLELYSRQTSMAERIICILVITTCGELFRSDYGTWGILMIFCFYAFREKRWLKLALVSGINVLAFGWIQSYAVFACIPIALYNGKKGAGMKYVFYSIYPLHLLLLYMIKQAM